MSVLWSAYTDEMSKLAVDTETLGRKVRVAKNVHIGADDVTRATGGAGTLLPPRVAKRFVGAVQAPYKKHLEALEFAHKIDQHFPAPLRSGVFGPLAANTRKVLDAGSALAAKADGSIHVDPFVLHTHGFPGVRSAAGDSALTSSVLAHELFERRVKAVDVRPIHYHASPGVLLKEHNLLSTLTGPGAEEARAAIGGLRQRSGEQEHIRNLLTDAFGPRAAEFLQDGQKIPKAMRRAVLRKIRDNPAVVDAAAPGAGRAIHEAIRAVKGAGILSRLLRR